MRISDWSSDVCSSDLSVLWTQMNQSFNAWRVVACSSTSNVHSTFTTHDHAVATATNLAPHCFEAASQSRYQHHRTPPRTIQTTVPSFPTYPVCATLDRWLPSTSPSTPPTANIAVCNLPTHHQLPSI